MQYDGADKDRFGDVCKHGALSRRVPCGDAAAVTEAKLPPAALDIILYLANNPSYNTAKDICCHKGLKPSIVSFHVTGW